MRKAENPTPFAKAGTEPALQYRFGGRAQTIDDYLAHQRATGLLVIKDGQILVERYQYDRRPTDRLLSNSMAKSLVSIGIGLALSERRIRSLDDKVAEYVPELKGNIYGGTTIRNLLRMASGARFTEDNNRMDVPTDSLDCTAARAASLRSWPSMSAKHRRASAFTTRRS